MTTEAEQSGPLAQFAIERIVKIDLGGFDASFTNSAMMMVIAVVLVTALLTLSVRGRTLVPSRLQSISEGLYEMVARMLGENLGPEGRPYFPFVFSLFVFLLFGNMLGLIPYAFTFTSHILVTFIFAAVVFIGVTLIGLIRHKHRFLKLFVPAGVPMFLLPLLVPIEIVSYLARPISLSVRLFANMMAGHTMVEVFASFVIMLGFLGFAPFLFIVLLYALESIVAFIQAYVFAILSCLYLRDALHPEH